MKRIKAQRSVSRGMCTSNQEVNQLICAPMCTGYGNSERGGSKPHTICSGGILLVPFVGDSVEQRMILLRRGHGLLLEHHDGGGGVRCWGRYHTRTRRCAERLAGRGPPAKQAYGPGACNAQWGSRLPALLARLAPMCSQPADADLDCARDLPLPDVAQARRETIEQAKADGFKSKTRLSFPL